MSGVAFLPLVREFVHVSVFLLRPSAGHFLTPQVARVELARGIVLDLVVLVGRSWATAPLPPSLLILSTLGFFSLQIAEINLGFLKQKRG